MKAKQILRAVAITAGILSLTLTSLPVQAAEYTDAKDGAVRYLKQRLSAKCPMASYEVDDPLLAASSYTYDNAMAAMALMSEGDYESAGMILDALVKGIESDAEFKDRFRNAYMVGKASDLPGYWDDVKEQWIQDAYHVGTGTKSTGAAALALLTYYGHLEKDKYLDAAITGVDWILENCQDDTPGFTAGYTGWMKVGAATILPYKATSDNLFLGAACNLLWEVTGWDKYEKAASSATTFVEQVMYSEGDSRFCTGTLEDGATPSYDLLGVEAQALATLCLEDDAGLDNLDRCQAPDGGYSYDNSNQDGSWMEGTAMVSLAFRMVGETRKADAALSCLASTQLFSGAIPQTSVPFLSTGEKNRVLPNYPSVCATAWFILAANGTNPFSSEAFSE